MKVGVSVICVPRTKQVRETSTARELPLPGLGRRWFAKNVQVVAELAERDRRSHKSAQQVVDLGQQVAPLLVACGAEAGAQHAHGGVTDRWRHLIQPDAPCSQPARNLIHPLAPCTESMGCLTARNCSGVSRPSSIAAPQPARHVVGDPSSCSAKRPGMTWPSAVVPPERSRAQRVEPGLPPFQPMWRQRIRGPGGASARNSGPFPLAERTGDSRT